MVVVALIDGSDKVRICRLGCGHQGSQMLIDTQMLFKMSDYNFLGVNLGRDCDWERSSGDDDRIVEHGLGIKRHKYLY